MGRIWSAGGAALRRRGWPASRRLPARRRIGRADDGFLLGRAHRFFLWPGLGRARGQRSLSLGLRYARTSGPFRALARAAGDTPSSGEYGAELSYSDRIAPFLLIQPDVQLIANPGGLSGARTAVVTTLRITIEVPPLFR